jgi:hypothetical protein
MYPAGLSDLSRAPCPPFLPFPPLPPFLPGYAYIPLILVTVATRLIATR